MLVSLEGHTKAVTSAVFSPDGSRVITASLDDTFKLWDVHLETRDPNEIAALVKCRVPWRLQEGKLVPATPDPSACPKAAAAR